MKLSSIDSLKNAYGVQKRPSGGPKRATERSNMGHPSKLAKVNFVLTFLNQNSKSIIE